MILFASEESCILSTMRRLAYLEDFFVETAVFSFTVLQCTAQSKTLFRRELFSNLQVYLAYSLDYIKRII